jgi:glycosyltransferase involved in cell wall biosynthesis
MMQGCAADHQRHGADTLEWRRIEAQWSSSPMQTKQALTLVIPAYNEGANFKRLWHALTTSIHSDFTAIVVCDFDEDDTIPEVNKVIESGEHRLALARNEYGRGVVGAIRTGFNRIRNGPVLVIMADLSDDLTIVDAMLDLYGQGYDVVVGSRYMPGGRINGGPLLKKTMSRMAGVSLRYLRGLPTHDATNAYKIYDAAMLRQISIESRSGFELNLELTVKSFLAGHPIAEIPSVWTDRTAGESKFKVWRWLPHYFRWYVHAFRPRRDVLSPQAR